MLPEPMASLMGKVERGAITNFYGAPGTGKTNLCMLASIDCVNKGGRVIYVDTEGGFSLERLKQLTKEYEDVLKGVQIINPKSFKEQGNVIRALKERKADLIVIDSLVSLYRLECANPAIETLEANRELSIQLSILSNIARDRELAVIVTSHVYKNWESKESYIVGGYTIKYWSKAIVFLEHTGKMGERKATIVKHRSLPEGRSVKFVLVNEGIKPTEIV